MNKGGSQRDFIGLDNRSNPSEDSSSEMLSSEEEMLMKSSGWMTDEKQSDDRFVWLFHQDINPRYARNLGLALRCGVVTAIVVLCAVVREDISIFGYSLRVDFLVPGNTLLLFALTIKPHFGQTLECARSGVFGRFLAILTSRIMLRVFPTESKSTAGVAAMFVLINVFVLLMLFLDFNMNTRKFAVASFVGHSMKFLNPEVSAVVNPYRLTPTSPMVLELLGAVLGCGLAVLTTLFPRPLLSLNLAGSTATALAKQLDETWCFCIKFMSGCEPDLDTGDRILKKLHAMSKQLPALQQAIENSAMEVAVLPRRFGVKRLMLQRLAVMLREGYDRLFSVWNICRHEKFEKSHAGFMEGVQDELFRVVRVSSQLMSLTVSAALDGRISHQERDALQACLDDAIAAQKALTDAFERAKAANPKRASPELIEERCLCFHSCASVRMAISVAEDFLQHCAGERRLDPVPPKPCTPLGINLSPGHLSFAIRNFATIMLGVVIGYYGFHKSLPRYNPGIAATSALLLSTFTGSAISNSLMRLQGVVLGNIFGQLMYAMFASCHIVSYFLVGSAAFFWSVETLRVSFHVPQVATVAILLNGFGMTELGKQCTERWVEPSMVQIINTCVAIVVGLGVDLVVNALPLPDGVRVDRASTQAVRSLKVVWTSFGASVASALNPDELETRKHSMRFALALANAEQLGQEASQELRYYRAPWKTNLFQNVLTVLTSMWMCLSTLEHTASGGVEGGNKLPGYVRIMRLPLFRQLREEIVQKMDDIGKMFDMFSNEHERALGMADSPSHKLSKSKRPDLDVVMKELLEMPGVPLPAGATLESDEHSIGCVLLEGCMQLLKELDDLRRSFLQEE